jgi:cell division protein FtsB
MRAPAHSHDSPADRAPMPAQRRKPATSRPTGRRPRAGTAPATSRRTAPPRSGTNRAGRDAPAGEEPKRRASLTGRAAVLALVVCALALTLAYPLRQLIAQRQEISDLRSQTTEQQQRVRDLQAQKNRWNDPAYIKAQAAQRLQYVLPGESSYVVLEPDDTPTAAPAPAAAKGDARGPWFSELWATVEKADRPAGTNR